MKRPLAIAAALVAAACAGRSTPSAAPAPARTAAPVAAAPAPLRYTAGTNHYRLDSRTHVEQEMMGQNNVVEITTAALFTTGVAAADGNLGVAITIDSLGITTAPSVGTPGPAELSAARGKVVRLVVSADGRPISLTPPDSASTTVQQMAQGLRDFLPQLPLVAPTDGAIWYDTTTTTTPSMGIAVTVKMARQHRVAGWEDHGGTRALHIATTATYTVTGSGEVQGQSVELTGGGQASSEAFVSAAGVYLGGSAADSALVNANVVSAGMVIPVRRTTRSTFTRLP